MEFKKKGNQYSFWHSPIALVLLLIFIGFFSYNVIGLIEKNRTTSNKKDIALEKIDELKKRQNDLKQDIMKFDTEEGQEEIIREKYQVAKTGEKMVIIVDDKPIQNEQLENKENHGFFNWLKSFFNKK